MAGAQNIPVGSAPVGHPLVVRHAVTRHWLMIMLSALVAVAGVAGVVISLMHGHNDWAIAVGIVASAFFARSAC